jgi:hypothetical protein
VAVRCRARRGGIPRLVRVARDHRRCDGRARDREDRRVRRKRGGVRLRGPPEAPTRR